jgi:hypothetical protein
MLCFVVGMALTGESRTIAMRCFYAAFGLLPIGMLVHFAAITADEFTLQRYGMAAWMAAWTTLLGFLMFAGLRLAILGWP